MNKSKVLVAAMVAVIPAYLIGSDLFFRSQVATSTARADASDRVLGLASAGFMRERRSLSLLCSAGGDAKLVLKAKIPGRGFLKLGETAPASVAFRNGGEIAANVDAPGTVVANGFVETVATPALTAAQLTQVARGLSRPGSVEITAMGVGLTLGADVTAHEIRDFIAGCGSTAAPGKQSNLPDGDRRFSREIARAA